MALFHIFILMKIILPFLILVMLSCSGSRKTTTLGEIVILPRSAWNANPAREFKQHTPKRITVHHEGTRLERTDDAAKKIRNIQVWGMGADRNWSDIPYHFLIAPDGTIYEGRAVTTVGETATEYDPTGHLLINCLGNLEVQELPAEQLTSLTRLIAHCSRKYNIPVDSLATHRDYSRQTTCPGKNLYQYFSNGYVLSEVKTILARSSGK